MLGEHESDQAPPGERWALAMQAPNGPMFFKDWKGRDQIIYTQNFREAASWRSRVYAVAVMHELDLPKCWRLAKVTI
ncbi:MAG: hypothetical protein SFV32_12625 [Opitutaceae bacterium]|nr:hypothetical protein [Opitutaceae bacterium]